MIDEILKLNDQVGTLTEQEKKSMQQIQEFLKNKISRKRATTAYSKRKAK